MFTIYCKCKHQIGHLKSPVAKRSKREREINRECLKYVLTFAVLCCSVFMLYINSAVELLYEFESYLCVSIIGNYNRKKYLIFFQ